MIDGRAGFRRVFCDLMRRSAVTEPSDPECEGLLWRMRDEASTSAEREVPPSAPAGPPLRFVLVTGAFDDCYGDEGLPFHDAATSLAAQGYRLDTVRLSGRSSAEANAEALAHAVRPMLSDDGGRLALIGYSKGAVDVLEFLRAHPDVADSVVAVVSVAGPVFGTPLASIGDGLYDTLLARAFAGRCSPGDGGVIDSLVPEARKRWFLANPLPGGIRFYSLLALPEWGVVARALKPSWRVLARGSRFNDGQVRAEDALIPGATLLGYANADHWGIALRIERVLPHIAARAISRPYPQRELLEAILLTVGGAPPP